MNIRARLYRKDDPFNFDIPSKVFKEKLWRERYTKRRRCAYLRFGGIGQCDMWEDEPHVHNGEMTLITTNYNHREDKLYDFTYNKGTKKATSAPIWRSLRLNLHSKTTSKHYQSKRSQLCLGDSPSFTARPAATTLPGQTASLHAQPIPPPYPAPNVAASGHCQNPTSDSCLESGKRDSTNRYGVVGRKRQERKRPKRITRQ